MKMEIEKSFRESRGHPEYSPWIPILDPTSDPGSESHPTPHHFTPSHLLLDIEARHRTLIT